MDDYGEDEFEPPMETWRRKFSSPGYQAAWKTYRMEFSPSFRKQIDELIRELNKSEIN
jgi:hypothetical protein